MTCFQWQNHASDFLDGALPKELQTQAQAHLKTCKECQGHEQHFRLILSTLSRQPRIALPAAIRRSPLLGKLPRTDSIRISRSRWEKVPWYLRTLIEGTGIVALVLLLVSSAPLLRALYEKNFEANLNEWSTGEALHETLADPAGSGGLTAHLADEKGESPTTPAAPAPQSLDRSEDLSGEDDLSDANPVTAGKSELWRFTLRTVTPDELRRQISQMLIQLEIPKNTEGLTGVQVPGGIEFDLVLSQSLVPKIKLELEKLAPPLPRQYSEKGEPLSERDSFSWYRVKSKRQVPAGKSQIVIWLAQPN